MWILRQTLKTNLLLFRISRMFCLFLQQKHKIQTLKEKTIGNKGIGKMHLLFKSSYFSLVEVKNIKRKKKILKNTVLFYLQNNFSNTIFKIMKRRKNIAKPSEFSFSTLEKIH